MAASRRAPREEPQLAATQEVLDEREASCELEDVRRQELHRAAEADLKEVTAQLLCGTAIRRRRRGPGGIEQRPRPGAVGVP